MLRSERMLNIEKYRDELIKTGVINTKEIAIRDGKPSLCCFGCCGCDNLSEEDCRKQTEDWLFSEYEEPEVDWSKIKVDTPILVRNTEKEEWQKRHFARFKNGKVYAWYDGLTSWSTAGEDDVNFWKYAKLAESEE